jgi:L-asparaginase
MFATKNHANNPDTFYSAEIGTIGYYLDQIPYFYFPPSRPIGSRYFDITNATVLPQVDIHYSHQDQNPHLVNASVALGARGIVYAGNGNGGIASKAFDAAEAIHNEMGISVVTSHKVPNGWAVSDGFAIGSGHLNPSKARVLLQLAVHDGMDDDDIRELFESLSPDPWA